MKTSFEEIQNMKKKEYMNTIKRKIEQAGAELCQAQANLNLSRLC